MAVGEAHVLPGFLTPVLTQISFQSHRLLFSHALAEVRGEYTPKKFRLNRVSDSQPLCHESNTLTTEPPRRGAFFQTPKQSENYLLYHTMSTFIAPDLVLAFENIVRKGENAV